MTATPQLSALSAARRQLVTLMQSVHFGRIEDLVVLEGEPVFAPPPRIVREIKLGRGERTREATEDFALKATVVDLLDQMSQLGSCRVSCLEIRHGLPQRLIVAGDLPRGGAA